LVGLFDDGYCGSSPAQHQKRVAASMAASCRAGLGSIGAERKTTDKQGKIKAHGWNLLDWNAVILADVGSCAELLQSAWRTNIVLRRCPKSR